MYMIFNDTEPHLGVMIAKITIVNVKKIPAIGHHVFNSSMESQPSYDHWVRQILGFFPTHGHSTRAFCHASYKGHEACLDIICDHLPVNADNLFW